MKFRFVQCGQSHYTMAYPFDEDKLPLIHRTSIVVQAYLPEHQQNEDGWVWVGQFENEKEAVAAATHFSESYKITEVEL